MRIQYTSTFLDIAMFNAMHQLMSPLLQAVMLLFAGYSFWLESTYGSSILQCAIYALACYAGTWMIQLLFNVIYLWSRKNHTMLTLHTVEIQEDAFYEETAYNKSYFFWHGIVKVVKRAGIIAVYISPHAAHLIPRRAFTSPAEREQFFFQLKGKVER